ncbi:hypothetical protein LEP1GSC058_0198 [Leptospira fainei serovar Hurstbridge str. BUT 6]|uniref:Uncharacterized protein n=1 Tax=Leptospira fainei serovar Hurstbridge str. BUT 6 TaxID=1193011 RepID=S3VE46_9LEPT|nr:hypothetical protein LEP1GSC058_0198 [Leptospira fainei serovar Hurstbridge str. BUT 6]
MTPLAQIELYRCNSNLGTGSEQERPCRNKFSSGPEHENIKAEVEKLNPSDVRLTAEAWRRFASPQGLGTRLALQDE